MMALLSCMDSEKKHFMADSWSGLPPPKDANMTKFRGGEFHVTYDWFREKMSTIVEEFQHFGWKAQEDWEDYVLKGWFNETLRQIPENQRFSFVRLDSDCYDCIYESLTFVYPKLSCGGYVYVDDYWKYAETRSAVKHYMDEEGLKFVPYSIAEPHF